MRNYYFIALLSFTVIATSYAATDNCSQYPNPDVAAMCRSLQTDVGKAKQNANTQLNNALQQKQQKNTVTTPTTLTPQAPITQPETPVVPQQKTRPRIFY